MFAQLRSDCEGGSQCWDRIGPRRHGRSAMGKSHQNFSVFVQWLLSYIQPLPRANERSVACGFFRFQFPLHCPRLKILYISAADGVFTGTRLGKVSTVPHRDPILDGFFPERSLDHLSSYLDQELSLSSPLCTWRLRQRITAVRI